MVYVQSMTNPQEEDNRPLTLREALLSMLSNYNEEVRSGRHVPPWVKTEAEGKAVEPTDS